MSSGAPSRLPYVHELFIGGSIDHADVAMLCERARVLLDASDAGVLTCDVSALVDPDALAIDALARLQLLAQRQGRSIRLRNAGRRLRDLLVVAGLREVLPCAGLPVEPERQTEDREQGRVDEVVDPADPVT